MREMKDSKYQIAIYDEYDNTRNNICVDATAGAGKTHTLLNLLKRTPEYNRVLFCAFNKSISEELQSKVRGSNVKVSTLHSLGYSILRYNLKRRFKLNEYKNFILFQEILRLDKERKFKDEKARNSYIFAVCDIVNVWKMNLCETLSERMDELNKRSILFSEEEVSDAVLLMDKIKEYNRKENHKEFMIDFTDMLYLVKDLIRSEECPKYDVVMVDECQDLNLLQQYILINVVKKRGRMVCVGDEHQSIYSFMGASPEAFRQLKSRPKTSTLPLSVSYRCERQIVEEAKKIFPDTIEVAPGAGEGDVRGGTLSEANEGDFVLCRNNLPLVEAFIYFLSQGKKCYILGKDFSQGLLNLISKVDADDVSNSLNTIMEELEDKLLEQGIKKPKNNKKYLALEEKVTILRTLASHYGDFNLLERKLGEVFKDKGEGTMLSTIHKAKGLEAERVFVYGFNELMPSPFAESEIEVFAEKCLMFVAITRAKRELVYVKYIKK